MLDFLRYHCLAFYLIVLPLVIYAYTAIVAAEDSSCGLTSARSSTSTAAASTAGYPSWHGWRAAIAGMRFNWRRVLVKEYITIFVVLLALVVVSQA